MGLVLLVFLHSTWIIQTWTLGERRKKKHRIKNHQNPMPWRWWSAYVCFMSLIMIFNGYLLLAAWRLHLFCLNFSEGLPPPAALRPRRQIEAEDLVTPGIDPSPSTFKSKISSLEVRKSTISIRLIYLVYTCAKRDSYLQSCSINAAQILHTWTNIL